MSTKVESNRTKRITTTEGAALVVLDVDESRMVVTGRINWKGHSLDLGGVDGNAGGATRGQLRDLAKAILEAVDASKWHEETAAVEAPAPKQDTPARDLADLEFPLRPIGDRNKDQAAPVGRPIADRPQS